MGKIKSAICLTLLSALIAVMCFFCTVSFRLNAIETFHSTVSLTKKDITLGSWLTDDTYVGGGFSAVYYPEGVISAKEYEDNLSAYEASYEELKKDKGEDAQKTKDAKKVYDDYKAQYPSELKQGGLYLDKEIASEKKAGKAVSAEFKSKIEKTFRMVKERYEALHVDGAKIEKASEYSLRVTLPQNYVARNYALQYMSYMGEVTVSYGSEESNATVIFPENKRNAVIGDYLKSFSSRTAADGTSYVAISFTQKGREIVKEKTAEASSTSSNKMFFKVGDDTPVQFSISSEVDQDTMYISGGFTSETAKVTAILMNSALKEGTSQDLTVTFGDMISVPATYGENSLMLLFIACAILIVAMAAFFFVRYGLLGFAHIFTYLLFLFSMLLCIWAIPFLSISVGTALGLMLASVVFAVCNAMPYEYARKEYAQGRTMTASVKAAYKKTFWHVFDLHAVLAALAFIVYGISIKGLASFAFVFGLGIGFSALCSILVGRLVWACMMAYTPKKGAFCRFKREEVEEDD